jgi:hypothetical protein
MGDHLADLVLAESSTEGNEFVDTASEAFVFRMLFSKGALPFPVADPHHAGIDRVRTRRRKIRLDSAEDSTASWDIWKTRDPS